MGCGGTTFAAYGTPSYVGADDVMNGLRETRASLWTCSANITNYPSKSAQENLAYYYMPSNAQRDIVKGANEATHPYTAAQLEQVSNAATLLSGGHGFYGEDLWKTKLIPAALAGTYRVTYARPDSPTPPRQLDVTTGWPGATIIAPKWAPK